MYSFPLKNPLRNQLWIQAVARKGFVPNKYSKLCSVHFNRNCFYDQPGWSYRLRLNDNAVPTIFTKSLSSANGIPSKARKLDFVEKVNKNSEGKKIFLLALIWF